MAKGYWGSRSKVFTIAKNTVEKGLQYAYRDRKVKKREFRGLWIQRINAGARQNNTTYSKLIADLKKANVELDRKILSELAVNEPKAFTAVVEAAQ